MAMKRHHHEPHHEPQGDDGTSSKKRNVAHYVCEMASRIGQKHFQLLKLRYKVSVNSSQRLKAGETIAINGSLGFVHTNTIKDHTHTDQHTHAMLLLEKETLDSAGLGPSSYAPIAELSFCI